MTIANSCILAACVLPLICTAIAKAGATIKARKEGGKGAFDNYNPREWAKGLTGWQQRAHAAQQNGFEALPLFIAAVILAQQVHADQARIDLLAMTFIGIRIAYIVAYVLNWAPVRSLIWAGGFAICLMLLRVA